MTELQILLTFLTNLVFQDCFKDVGRLTRQIAYIIRHEDWDQAAQLVLSLLSLEESVTTGINTKRFVSVVGLATYSKSVLPKFLYGLTSQVFDDDGYLIRSYSQDAFELIVTALRLVKRATIPTFGSIANEAAIASFIDSQSAPQHPVGKDAIDIIENVDLAVRDVWTHLLRDFDANLTLGFPGNGVTSNMRFDGDGYFPGLSFVDTDTLPPLVKPIVVATIGKYLPEDEPYLADGPCTSIKLYPYTRFRASKVVSVPKSFKTGRGITITDTASVQIAAILRETIWQCFRELGLMRFVNVHNQADSHRVLFQHYFSRFLRDLRGGSTCYSIDRQISHLSGSLSAVTLFVHSVPDCIEVNGEYIKLNTITMGDASTTALLTGNLFCLAVLSYLTVDTDYTFGERVTREQFDSAIDHLRTDGKDAYRFVGDDVIGPREHMQVFDTYLALQGVSINTNKSSNPNDPYKETCGCWGIGEPNVLFPYRVRRISPFRAASMSGNVVSDLSTLTAYVERTHYSKFRLELLIANATFFRHQLEYLDRESYDPNTVGSPVGATSPSRCVKSRPRQRVKLPDSIAYIFGLGTEGITTRKHRKPDLVRGRLCKITDPSRPPDKQSSSERQDSPAQQSTDPVQTHFGFDHTLMYNRRLSRSLGLILNKVLA